MCTYWAVNTWLPVILSKERGVSPNAFSSFLLALQFMAILGYIVAAFFSTKFGNRKTMAAASFLSAVTLYVWLGMEWEDNLFYTFGAINWMVASVIWAVLASYLVEQFPTNIRALGVSAGYSTGRLIATVIPLIMGAAAKGFGMTIVMAAMAVFYLICMFGVLMLRDTKGHM
jgi:sugar phosphate permease